MKRRRQIPFWLNWIFAVVLFVIIFVVFYGLVNYVLFSEIAIDNYGNGEHMPIDRRIFTRKALLWFTFLIEGVFFVAGWVVHGWIQIEEVDNEK